MTAERDFFDIGGSVEHLRSRGITSATKNFIRGLITSGQVAHIRIGKKFYVSRTQLDLWLEKHERRAR
jgi:excisionase family DNA binding protein